MKHWIVERQWDLVRIPTALIKYLNAYTFVNALEVSMAVADYVRETYKELFEDWTDLSYGMCADCDYAAWTYLTLMKITEDSDGNLNYSNARQA